MKLLNGLELAGFIKERQAKQVRGLRQAHSIFPKLAIIQTKHDPAIDLYVRLKKQYGEDILVAVDSYVIEQSDTKELILKLNNDDSVHGIIIQLPLEDSTQTQEICDLVAKNKDVDALGEHAVLDPATPTAIMWLLAGYGIELRAKSVAVIGQGRLVGGPLTNLLKQSGIDVTVADAKTNNLSAITRGADVVITATGSPGLIKSVMLKQGAVVVDAGTASEGGVVVGDLDPDVYERDDLTITPQKGGVGPLTICALFDNVIKTAMIERK